MAIGGSMTETTHASVLYMPSTSSPESHSGAAAAPSSRWSGRMSENSPSASRAEGRFAPVMVMKKIPNSIRIMMGMPVRLEVRIRSIRRSRAWYRSSFTVITRAGHALARLDDAGDQPVAKALGRNPGKRQKARSLFALRVHLAVVR